MILIKTTVNQEVDLMMNDEIARIIPERGHHSTDEEQFSDTEGAFLLSELAGQTRQVANKMKQFDNPSYSSGGVYIILEVC